jgi:type IV secretion system protein VirD4
MVSRQETARPLLTPGEVMQLPPDDELVLVSGVPPIRARKARYFEDSRLTERVLASPAAREQDGARPPDDWSQLPAPVVVTNPEAYLSGKERSDDPANGGIRREPELPQHEEIAREPVKSKPEFAFGEETPDEDAARARALRQQVRNLARQGAMDPDDGMGL